MRPLTSASSPLVACPAPHRPQRIAGCGWHPWCSFHWRSVLANAQPGCPTWTSAWPPQRPASTMIQHAISKESPWRPATAPAMPHGVPPLLLLLGQAVGHDWEGTAWPADHLSSYGQSHRVTWITKKFIAERQGCRPGQSTAVPDCLPVDSSCHQRPRAWFRSNAWGRELQTLS